MVQEFWWEAGIGHRGFRRSATASVLALDRFLRVLRPEHIFYFQYCGYRTVYKEPLLGRETRTLSDSSLLRVYLLLELCQLHGTLGRTRSRVYLPSSSPRVHTTCPKVAVPNWTSPRLHREFGLDFSSRTFFFSFSPCFVFGIR